MKFSPGGLKLKIIWTLFLCRLVPHKFKENFYYIFTTAYHCNTSNSMEQISPSEANIQPASQEIPRLLCNIKVHYSVHKGLPLVPVLCKVNPDHILTSVFFMIYFNIILPCMNGITLSGFRNITSVCTSHISTCASRPNHLIFLDLITLIISDEE
jgi:hypothetical protein